MFCTHVASLDIYCRALGEGQRLPWVMLNVLVSIICDCCQSGRIKSNGEDAGLCSHAGWPG